MTPSACDIMAFLIIECRISITEAENLSLSDPLYKSLEEAWKTKIEREDRWVALQSLCAASAFGGGKNMDINTFRHYKWDRDLTARKSSGQEEYAKWVNYSIKHSAIQRMKNT